jgi:cell division protein FtsZ
MIQFDLPKEHSSIIKVVGVGGGGSNAVNYMFSQDIDGVNFVICNTDAQAIATSKVPNKIQLGPHLTQGLGAGANPEIGRQATEESLEEIKRILEVNTKMVFITAGMGGGTGTGGAPIVAKICRDLGILTVGIVTTPFSYEGKKRIQQAEEGINKLKEYVDTLLVISNDKLRHQFGNLTMRAAFTKADNVLATAAKCITDVISSTGQINVDFADVCTVMRKGGVAILGSATANGENRAQRAIESALNSPLLNDNDIRGAKWILININSAEGENEFTMDEVEIIQNYLLTHAGSESDVILGLGYDSNLEDNIGITLIATGFEHRDPFEGTMIPQKKNESEEQKIVMTLGVEGEEKKLFGQPALPFDDRDPLAPMLVDATRQSNPETQDQKLTQALQDHKPEVFVLSMEETPATPEVFQLHVEEKSESPEVFQFHVEEKPESPEVFQLHVEEQIIDSAPLVFALHEEENPVAPIHETAQFSMMKVEETPMPAVDEMPMERTLQPELPENPEIMEIPVAEEEISEKIELVYLSSITQVPVDIKPAEAENTVSPLSDLTEEGNKDASTTTTSGGFLAKPSNIYAEEPIDLKSKQESFEDLVKFGMEEDGPIFDMQIVIKEPKAVEEPVTPSIHATLGSVEEPAMQDEAEDQKRKAAERLHKLRNLSFNIHAADPNNEFESVPAYIRRNLEVHNTTLTSVEKFYSNYTVKSDENNKGQISTINTFLEGKKPD